MNNTKNIYIENLGYRNPIDDIDQIIWFFNQITKTKSKGELTKYWLNLKDLYQKRLITLQAYELLGYLKDKTTTEQEERRKKSQEKTKLKAEKALKEFLDQYKNSKYQRELALNASLN